MMPPPPTPSGTAAACHLSESCSGGSRNPLAVLLDWLPDTPSRVAEEVPARLPTLAHTAELEGLPC